VVQLSDKITIQKVDGPYSHKSPTDLIAVIGFVTEVHGSDAVFRDCSGTTKAVRLSELTRVRRNCSPGGPAGIWARDPHGNIVPLYPDANYARVFSGGKPQIDPDMLPAEYKNQVGAAKPGEWIAVSFPTEKGKLDLSFINEAGPKR
jgi:hypothetical protein